jgi:hypothetical protein
MLSEYTDDALAEAFAEDVDGECLYVSSRGGWFVRKFDDATGKRVWAPDDTLRVWVYIRDFLRRVVSGRQQNDGLARGLLSAERIQAVEFLARSDLTGDEESLAPGALAVLEVMLAELHRGRASGSDAT